MDRQELIDNLGTVARSGTRAFISKLAEAKDGAGLIGQFGVGLLFGLHGGGPHRGHEPPRRIAAKPGSGPRPAAPASRSRRPSEAQAARVPRGTEIVLHLKDDAKKYLEPHEIRRVVIDLFGPHPVPDRARRAEGKPRADQLGERAVAAAEVRAQAGGLQAGLPTIAHAFDEPAMTLHYRAEGRHSYAVLLFAPSTRPFDLFDPARKGHVKLYVRRVYITDDADLLPSYLRFIRGVVDSEDLPLNISREMLQNNPQVAQIRKALTGRVISELESLAEKDAEAFGKIWEAFGPVLKEGIYEDYEKREQLLALARFTTTAGTGRARSSSMSRTSSRTRPRSTISPARAPSG